MHVAAQNDQDMLVLLLKAQGADINSSIELEGRHCSGLRIEDTAKSGNAYKAMELGSINKMKLGRSPTLGHN